MAKGTKLSEFEKGEITALKISEILKALERSKTVICNYLKSPNIDRQARKIISTIQENDCSWSKKENFINIKNTEISCGCSLQH